MMPTDGILLGTALMTAFSSAAVIVTGSAVAILGTLALVNLLSRDGATRRGTIVSAGVEA